MTYRQTIAFSNRWLEFFGQELNNNSSFTKSFFIRGPSVNLATNSTPEGKTPLAAEARRSAVRHSILALTTRQSIVQLSKNYARGKKWTL
jgi:hypothetical protein